MILEGPSLQLYIISAAFRWSKTITWIFQMPQLRKQTPLLMGKATNSLCLFCINQSLSSGHSYLQHLSSETESTFLPRLWTGLADRSEWENAGRAFPENPSTRLSAASQQGRALSLLTRHLCCVNKPGLGSGRRQDPMKRKPLPWLV